MAADETPAIRVLAGGVSNKTVLVERPGGAAWVLKQSLAKLRTEADWFSDPARIRREALGLTYLHQLAPPGAITPLVFEDPRHDLLAMEAVPRPHENWKAMLLAGRIEGDHVEQFATLLGTIHRRAAESPLPLREVFGDQSFFESLRLEPYYEYAAARVPAAAGFLRDLVRDTRARRLTLVHGDYSPKNVLVRAGRLVLLDHEVIHWGDPAFDVGFALTHLLSKARHLRGHRTQFLNAARQFCDVYASSAGPFETDPSLQPMIVRHTLGCLLARVAGRSPLEYLTPQDRRRQQDAAVASMNRPAATLAEFIESYFACGMNDADH
jgi:tRNA A-37 threonylcarbamoyl transferase component Bud32